MKNQCRKYYQAAIYLRLSKEDGDVTSGGRYVSNSISNQKDLITDYIKSMTEIEVVSIRTDDGYSGVDFERPEFRKMMEDIRKGMVNCVIVKDLSRFGRNYIEAGRYLEKIFPLLGVRFIAVNDNYDSNHISGSQDILLAFKNLINDSYLRDLSVKIRSHLEVKRKNGEFTGPFSCYGYLKSPENKNRLIVDTFAAEVVKDIYKMKLEGMSPGLIAAELNQKHILSPAEYKKSLGISYETGFQLHHHAVWGAQAVFRILTDEVYTGTLLQGKRTSPNHKMKKIERADKKEWIRVENTHEPIISKQYFDIIQRILERDTRTSPQKRTVYPLSGLIFCGDCGSPMIRKVNTGAINTKMSVPKQYIYYLCRQNRQKRECTGHRIKENELFPAIMHEINFHIKSMTDFQNAFDETGHNIRNDYEINKWNRRIRKMEEERNKAEELKSGLYEDYKACLLNSGEYKNLKKEFDKRVLYAKEAIEIYHEEIKKIKNTNPFPCHLSYDKYQKCISVMTRTAAVLFIDRILVYEDSRIRIKYTFGDLYDPGVI